MESEFTLGKFPEKGRKRASPRKTVSHRNAKTPNVPTNYIFRTEHDTKFMVPFLNLIRSQYPSDKYSYCVYHINLLIQVPPVKGQIVAGFTGDFTTFTRDKKSLDIISYCLYLNQKFRWNMKRLIHRWRIQRCEQMNTEDVFTCEVPEKLITVYDWDQRRKYAFEATTIYRDILTKIRNAEGLFVNPLTPKNPYTNRELTYGQVHFTIRALIRYGFNSWIFDALKRSDYNVVKLIEYYEYPLKNDNLIAVFRKYKEVDCTSLVFECISEEYIHHGVDIPYRPIWLVALEEHPDIPIIQRWRGLALKREKLLCRYEDGDFLNYRMQEIHKESEVLINEPLDDIEQIHVERMKRRSASISDYVREYNIRIIDFNNWYNIILPYTLARYEEPSFEWDNNLDNIIIDIDL